MKPQGIPAVGGISLTDLSPVSHLLNAPTRRLTWLTIIKASVAVAVAWQIASALPGDDSPLFAPIVALTTVQSSLYGTFAQGFQTAAGNIIGVALATGLVNVAGRTAVALFVATFVGLAVSKQLPIGSGARGQITFSMILVVALGPTSGYGTARLLDCAIGGAIGILVALLVPESPQIEPVRTAITGWSRELRESLREIAAALAVRDGQPVPTAAQHPFVDRMINRLRAADEALTSSVSVAFESIQFNPRARRKKAKVQELADVLPWCRRLSLQVEALALGVDALYDRSVHEPRVDRLTLSGLLFDAAALVPTSRPNQSRRPPRPSGRGSGRRSATPRLTRPPSPWCSTASASWDGSTTSSSSSPTLDGAARGGRRCPPWGGHLTVGAGATSLRRAG